MHSRHLQQVDGTGRQEEERCRGEAFRLQNTNGCKPRATPLGGKPLSASSLDHSHGPCSPTSIFVVLHPALPCRALRTLTSVRVHAPRQGGKGATRLLQTQVRVGQPLPRTHTPHLTQQGHWVSIGKAVAQGKKLPQGGHWWRRGGGCHKSREGGESAQR
jgi:hypothetical protein